MNKKVLFVCDEKRVNGKHNCNIKYALLLLMFDVTNNSIKFQTHLKQAPEY